MLIALKKELSSQYGSNMLQQSGVFVTVLAGVPARFLSVVVTGQ